MSMSHFESDAFTRTESAAPLAGQPLAAKLHRLKSVRQEQGYTLRRVAQQMKVDLDHGPDPDMFSCPLVTFCDRQLGWWRVRGCRGPAART